MECEYLLYRLCAVLGEEADSVLFKDTSRQRLFCQPAIRLDYVQLQRCAHCFITSPQVNAADLGTPLHLHREQAAAAGTSCEELKSWRRCMLQRPCKTKG